MLALLGSRFVELFMLPFQKWNFSYEYSCLCLLLTWTGISLDQNYCRVRECKWESIWHNHVKFNKAILPYYITIIKMLEFLLLHISLTLNALFGLLNFCLSR